MQGKNGFLGLFVGFMFLSPVLLAGTQNLFDGCPATGSATMHTRADPNLNALKNREATPGKYETMTAAQIIGLPVPAGVSKNHRVNWPQEALQTVGALENKGVSVEGYILKVKLEGKESTNCFSMVPNDRDFHIWLAGTASEPRSNSVVVEITPRIRAKHAAWSQKNLNRFIKQKSKVRISGWLMLDPEHPDQVGKTRGTIWEVHPVLKVEIWTGGKWVEL